MFQTLYFSDKIEFHWQALETENIVVIMGLK